MELGSGVDRRALLSRDNINVQPFWWESWLCSRTDTALHIDALRVVRMNIALEIMGVGALIWTLCTEPLHWTDVWDGMDLLLALPTLFALLGFRADPPPRLARWCCVLCAAYAVNVVYDVVRIFSGSGQAGRSRTVTALIDAGSLWMWMQCVYYNRELARALAQWQAPIAIVTVGDSGHIEARIPLSPG